MALAAAALTLAVAAVAVADPSADFSMSAATVARDQPVTFTAIDACAAPVTCQWSDDAGVIGVGHQITHAYGTIGLHSVTLTIDDPTDGSGAPSTLQQTLTVVNRDPVVSFTASATGLSVAFDSGASDPDGDALSYAWDFGDGSTASTLSPTHVFAAAGSYPVALTVTDALGGTASSERQLTVQAANRAPTAAITVTPSTARVGQAVTFGSAGSSDPDGDAITRRWELDGNGDFADGSTESVTHAYTAPGDHPVRLEVTDEHGLSRIAFATVSVVDALPTGAVGASSTAPLTAEPITFSALPAADPNLGGLDFAWDLDGDGAFDDATGPTAAHAYALPGAVKVSVRISDAVGSVSESVQVDVQNRAPLAVFTWSPDVVQRGSVISFSSRASDPEGLELAEQSWDLDGDGAYDDAFGASTSHTFGSGGTHVVGLRVVDQHGAATEARIPIVAGNRSPVASFTMTPERLSAGGTLRLSSTSSDPDGTVAQQQWDLDGDGEFDDATGATAERRFDAPGKADIGLRVVDDDGAANVVFREVEVVATSAPAAQPLARAPVKRKPVKRPRMLKPFPSVRIAGQVSARGAVLRLVSVTAPRGSRITWTCRGRNCGTVHGATARRRMRLRAVQGAYRAGSVVEIRITRRGWIGKYTRIAVRKGRVPARRDLCLFPGTRKPRSCPAR